jgi:hypothetical protein
MESRGRSVWKVMESDVEHRHFQGCIPRLCQLRTDGLSLVSKYLTYRLHTGDMGPVSLVVGCQQKIGFAPPTASMIGIREKLSTDSRIDQSSCCGLDHEPFFSGAMTLLNSVGDYTKGCYTWTTQDTYDRGPYADRV